MSVFVQITDFSAGRYKLALNRFNESDLQSLIDSKEKDYVVSVFGIELGEMVYANPNDYTDLTDPFYIGVCGDIVKSKGLTEMLKAFIYFFFIREQYTRSVVSGVSRVSGENSTNEGQFNHDVVNRWNEGVVTYRAIQERVIDELDDYPLFDGQRLDYIIPL